MVVRRRRDNQFGRRPNRALQVFLFFLVTLVSSGETGDLTPKQFAKALAKIEVEGNINQIKVASEIGFRYEAKSESATNRIIDDYSKDNTIDLRTMVLPGTALLKDYEKQGTNIRDAYIKQNPKIIFNKSKN